MSSLMSSSFAYVIEAWARQEDSASAQRAEDIVEHMHKQHDEGVTDVKPTLMCYKWAILAWTRSGDPSAALKAEAILRRAQERNIQPTNELITPIYCRLCTKCPSQCCCEGRCASAGNKVFRIKAEKGSLQSAYGIHGRKANTQRRRPELKC